jgi:methyl-accepting chemotaxis protein
VAVLCGSVLLLAWRDMLGMASSNDKLRYVYEDRTMALIHIARVRDALYINRDVMGRALMMANVPTEPAPTTAAATNRSSQWLGRLAGLDASFEQGWQAYRATRLSRGTDRGRPFRAELETYLRERNQVIELIASTQVLQANRRWTELTPRLAAWPRNWPPWASCRKFDPQLL